MTDIKATVPFNQQSQTYEISVDSPFNVTCSYKNLDTSLTYAKVQWTAVSQNDLFLLYFNGHTFPGVRALPSQIPITENLSDGVITLLVDSVLPLYKYFASATKITYQCSVITVVREPDGNYLEAHTNHSLEILVSISTATQKTPGLFTVNLAISIYILFFSLMQ
ncbi:hypothetical protein EB796_009994 [Bugula neritina]|uniref:Uncharacterized protein n=1 Tax=Bugula neritina TaxID=10212 RepID=A0A7J7JZ67_BUGNE|nr:hypothetical protein EB796_009994 [Bugula neritina]